VTAFGSFEEIDAETPYDGIDRRVLTTPKATVQEYRFEPGASFPIHHHPQEQITVVLDGEVSFSADGERRDLRAGEWSVVPGDVPHGVTAGPAGARFIAILVPPRKEPLT
jgi:quercetin dioxygenase-like cupin family protein